MLYLSDLDGMGTYSWVLLVDIFCPKELIIATCFYICGYYVQTAVRLKVKDIYI